jgi:hydrogenase nickel incorporation protein HypB
MCSICGCGHPSADAQGNDHAHARHDHAHAHGDHAHGEDHEHGHDHDHEHDHAPAQDHVHRADGSIDFGAGPAAVHVPGIGPGRIVRIERDIMEKNNEIAGANRARFAALGTLALNLVSSPGSGKTSLLVRTINDLKARHPIAVIEGDQQTANDAERIRATGVRAVQINTGKACHLDAHMVAHALDDLALETHGIMFIENVGNLICPAGFDLGEAHKVVVLSVTEGEDKPLKYPDMFAAADLMLLNKADLLPHLDFDVGICLGHALQINPRLQTLVVSARTGEGMAAFYAWLEARVAYRQDVSAATAAPAAMLKAVR